MFLLLPIEALSQAEFFVTPIPFDYFATPGADTFHLSGETPEAWTRRILKGQRHALQDLAIADRFGALFEQLSRLYEEQDKMCDIYTRKITRDTFEGKRPTLYGFAECSETGLYHMSKVIHGDRAIYWSTVSMRIAASEAEEVRTEVFTDGLNYLNSTFICGDPSQGYCDYMHPDIKIEMPCPAEAYVLFNPEISAHITTSMLWIEGPHVPEKEISRHTQQFLRLRKLHHFWIAIKLKRDIIAGDNHESLVKQTAQALANQLIASGAKKKNLSMGRNPNCPP